MVQPEKTLATVNQHLKQGYSSALRHRLKQTEQIQAEVTGFRLDGLIRYLHSLPYPESESTPILELTLRFDTSNPGTTDISALRRWLSETQTEAVSQFWRKYTVHIDWEHCTIKQVEAVRDALSARRDMAALSLVDHMGIETKLKDALAEKRRSTYSRYRMMNREDRGGESRRAYKNCGQSGAEADTSGARVCSGAAAGSRNAATVLCIAFARLCDAAASDRDAATRSCDAGSVARLGQ